MNTERARNKLLAIEIHAEVCDCDDKRCPLPSEIRDWLDDGDTRQIRNMNIQSLAEDWREYNQPDEEAGDE